MQSRSSIIASFILVSLLVVGGVEYFCRSLGNALSVEKKAEQFSPATDTIALPGVSKQQIGSSEKTRKNLVAESYTIITKRGLFGKVKPAEVLVKNMEPAPKPLQKTTLNLVLMGTISGEGDVQRAIIFDKKEKTQDIYYRGDAIGTAIIKEVKRGEIILKVGGKDEFLLMEELDSLSRTGGGASMEKPAAGTFSLPLPKPKRSIKKRRKAVGGSKFIPSIYPKRNSIFQAPNKQETDQ